MAPSRGIAPWISTCRMFLPQRISPSRNFTSSASFLSGHNRWSKIKHDKGKNDAAKNRQRSIFAQEIALASKMFGPEPSMNPRLADLITKAKREGFAKASIEAAIARGQGRSLSGATLEHVTVEGMLPGNVGVIVECETDGRARTLQAVRLAMKEAGGNVTPSAFLFEKKGRVTFAPKEGVGLEEVFEAALEAGATDVEESDASDDIAVFCEPGDTKAIGETVAAAVDLNISTSEIIWSPIDDTVVHLPDAQVAHGLGAFLDDIQEKETSVSAIAMNVAQGKLSDEKWDDLQTRLSA